MGVVPRHPNAGADAAGWALADPSRRPTTTAPTRSGWGPSYEKQLSDRADVARLQALLAGRDRVLHLLAVGEGLEPVAGDGAVVDEHVRGAVLGRDEAEALCLVEPLDGALSHEFPSTGSAPHCCVGLGRRGVSQVEKTKRPR